MHTHHFALIVEEILTYLQTDENNIAFHDKLATIHIYLCWRFIEYKLFTRMSFSALASAGRIEMTIDRNLLSSAYVSKMQL